MALFIRRRRIQMVILAECRMPQAFQMLHVHALLMQRKNLLQASQWLYVQSRKLMFLGFITSPWLLLIIWVRGWKFRMILPGILQEDKSNFTSV